MCKHFWLIEPNNKGRCKLCGKKHDFNEDNKLAFPEDYAKGFSRGVDFRRILVSTNGYCIQGSIPKGNSFGTHEKID